VHWFGPLSFASNTQPPLPSIFHRPTVAAHWSGPSSLASK